MLVSIGRLLTAVASTRMIRKSLDHTLGEVLGDLVHGGQAGWVPWAGNGIGVEEDEGVGE